MRRAHIDLQRFTVALLVVVLLGGTCSAQQKKETIEAIAYGQGERMGQNVALTLAIESYSTPEEQDILWKAFNKSGNQGVANALKKMPVRGRLSFTGVAPYDVTYIREMPTATGRKIRLVTNRAIMFSETTGYSSFSEFNLSAMELNISTEKGKSVGVLLPACKFSITKERGLELDVFWNPWTVGNITLKESE